MIRRELLAGMSMFAAGKAKAQMVDHVPAPRRLDIWDPTRGVASYAASLAPFLPAMVRIFMIKLVPAKDGSGNVPVIFGSGSGAIFDADAGLIFTNAHVAAQPDTAALMVDLTDGRKLLAKVVGIDQPTDLAVLQADVPGLPALRFADSDVLRIGDLVFAIGFPRGLDLSVSAGIVSGLGHRTDFDDTANGFAVQDFIQTDAAINHGNSGGPLLDSAGRVVGINAFIREGDSGLGFAIASRTVVPILRELREHGHVERGVLGVNLSNVEPKSIEEAVAPGERGALVTSVAPNSAADHAGIVPGDVITGAGDATIDSMRDLLDFVRTARLDRTYRVYLRRNDQVLNVPVRLLLPDGNLPRPSDDEIRGAVIADPPFVLRGRGSGQRRQGVLILQVRAGTAVARAGLLPGDFLVEIARSPVTSQAMAWQSLYSGGDHMTLTVERGNQLFNVALGE